MRSPLNNEMTMCNRLTKSKDIKVIVDTPSIKITCKDCLVAIQKIQQTMSMSEEKNENNN